MPVLHSADAVFTKFDMELGTYFADKALVWFTFVLTVVIQETNIPQTKDFNEEFIGFYYK